MLETRSTLVRMLQLSRCLYLHSSVLLREMSSDSQDSLSPGDFLSLQGKGWSCSVVPRGPRHLSDVRDRDVQAAYWLVTTQRNVYTVETGKRSHQVPCVQLPVETGVFLRGPLERRGAGSVPRFMALDFIWKHAQSASQHCFVCEQIFAHWHTLAPKPGGLGLHPAPGR